jgi:tellurite resistance protein
MDDASPPMPVKQVSVSGTFQVPREGQMVMFRVWIGDVTESLEKAKQLRCFIPDITDAQGNYSFTQELSIPHQFLKVEMMPITSIPLFALRCPRQGIRRLRVSVAITPIDQTSPKYASGTKTFQYLQTEMGYVDLKERWVRTQALENQVAILALATSADDGHMGKDEAAVIREYFRSRFEDSDEGEERRERVNTTLKSTFQDFLARRKKPRKVIGAVCQKLVKNGDTDLLHEAYELCVRVVAADGDIHRREQQVLDYVAEKLRLPEGFVREVHDQNFRLNMFGQADEERSVGMPSGLTSDEKREFLNQEYRKWSRRQAHSDSAIAADASLRLSRIAALRAELDDA